MNPIHDNQGNLIAIEMHNTRISAEALSQMAARVAALEAQIAECQQANTALIVRVVELEHERDAARLVIRLARERLYDAHGRSSHEVYLVILAVGKILRRDEVPPALTTAPGRCDHCGLPLVSSHIADETIITNGTRQVGVHRACASAYPDWTPVATARGGANNGQ